MNSVNVIKDLCVLTTIPQSNLEKLVDLAESSISHALVESALSNETITELNIGIGKLYITDTENGILYKFVPSREMSSVVSDALSNKKSKVVRLAEGEMKKRIENTYKDMF